MTQPKCDVCPLGTGCISRAGKPVKSVIMPGSVFTAVTSLPSAADGNSGQLLSDRDGGSFMRARAINKLPAQAVSVVPIISCAPAKGGLDGWRHINFTLVAKRKELKAKLLAEGYSKGAAEKEAKARLPHPATCCYPRLIHELSQGSPWVLAMGKEAYNNVTGHATALAKVRGGLQDAVVAGRTYHVLATEHPNTMFIFKKESHKRRFALDMGKLVRHMNGGPNFVTPDCTTITTASELDAWFAANPSPFYAFDTETSFDDPLKAKVNLVQFGVPPMDHDGPLAVIPYDRIYTRPAAVAVRFASVATGEHTLPPDEEERIVTYLKQVLEDPNIVKVGTNIGYFDRQVVLSNWGIKLTNYRDQLFAARATDPDEPKGLKYQAQKYMDPPRWENTDKGESAVHHNDDAAHTLYGQYDVAVGAQLDVGIWADARQRGFDEPLNPMLKPSHWATTYKHLCRADPAETPAWTLHNVDHWRQSLCGEMHVNGLWINQDKVRHLAAKYDVAIAGMQQALDKTLIKLSANVALTSILSMDEGEETENEADEDGTSEESGVNIRSNDVLRKLLYKDWGLGCPPSMTDYEFLTDSGLEGVGNAVLLAHIASGRLNPLQTKFLTGLRILRRWQNKMRPMLRRLTPRSRDNPKGLIWEDGRVHATYNAHVTAPARLAAANPNTMNQGARKGQEEMQEVWAAPPGRLYVAADVDQFHIRIMANNWAIPRFLDSFSEGIDPHVGLAYKILEMDAPGTLAQMSGWEQVGGFSLKKKPKTGQAGDVRQVFKVIGYTMAYLAAFDEAGITAGANLISNVLKATETGAFNLDGSPRLYPWGVQELVLPYLNSVLYEAPNVRRWLSALLLGPRALEPEWVREWQRAMCEYKENEQQYGVGFTSSYYFNRKSGSLSGGKPQEVANSKILPAEADLMSLMEMSVVNLIRTKWSAYNARFVLQVHDAIKVEMDDPYPRCHHKRKRRGDSSGCVGCDWRYARADELEDAMFLHIPGEPVAYTVESHWGYHLGEV